MISRTIAKNRLFGLARMLSGPFVDEKRALEYERLLKESKKDGKWNKTGVPELYLDGEADSNVEEGKKAAKMAEKSLKTRAEMLKAKLGRRGLSTLASAGDEVHPGVVVGPGERLVYLTKRPRRHLTAFAAPGVLGSYLGVESLLTYLGYGAVPPKWVTGIVAVTTGLLGWAAWRFMTSEILAIVLEEGGTHVRIYTVGMLSKRPRSNITLPIPLLSIARDDGGQGSRLLRLATPGPNYDQKPKENATISWLLGTAPGLVCLKEPQDAEIPDIVLFEGICSGVPPASAEEKEVWKLYWKRQDGDGSPYFYHELTNDVSWSRGNKTK